MKYKVDAEMIDSQGESDAAYQLCGDWDGLGGLLTAFRETLEAPLWLENAEGEVELRIKIRKFPSSKNVGDYIWDDGGWCFAEEKMEHDLWFDVPVDSEKGKKLIDLYHKNKPTLVFMNDNGAPPESIAGYIEKFLDKMNQIARGE